MSESNVNRDRLTMALQRVRGAAEGWLEKDGKEGGDRCDMVKGTERDYEEIKRDRKDKRQSRGGTHMISARM